MRTMFVSLVLVGSLAGGATYYAKHMTGETPVVFRAATIKRGDLLSTITATGTLEPEELVDVGAQVAGLITAFGKDRQGKTIDFNSVVEEGMELAYIDKSSYQAAFDQAEASFEKAKADLMQYQAKLYQTEQELKRAESLRPTKAIADTDYDTTLANHKVAIANVRVAEAVIKQNKAALDVAKTNLGYTTIKSPVRGTIIARRVNIGQTVVAALNAPSVFLIAKDLRRMQVWAPVNEADVGQMRVDMPVSFTVDAFPGKTFRGKVAQVRMNVTMTQSVVTYTVVVTTDNSSGKLLPYLSANARFEVDHRTGVLTAPNSALRWRPQTSQIEPAARAAASSVLRSSGGEERGRVWVATGTGMVRPVEVVVGISDGIMTEVSGEGVSEGMQIILGDAEQEELQGEQSTETTAGEGKTSSPFLPTPPKGSRPPPPM